MVDYCATVRCGLRERYSEKQADACAQFAACLFESCRGNVLPWMVKTFLTISEVEED